MSLKEELDAFRSEFMAKVSPEIREAMAQADMELAASGIARNALKAGDRAPDFRLPDARGGYVRFKDLLAKGEWWWFLSWRLVSLLQSGIAVTADPLSEINRLGAGLVQYFRQTPDESLSTAEKNSWPSRF